jgi:hypothetical protein
VGRLTTQTRTTCVWWAMQMSAYVRRSCLLFAVLFLVRPLSAGSAKQADRAKALKKWNVSVIERGLPEKPLESWLKEVAGPEVRFDWSGSGCLAPGPNPASSRCLWVEIFRTARGQEWRAVKVVFVVEEYKKQLMPPKVFEISVSYEGDGDHKSPDTLTELGTLLRQRQ